MSFIYGAQYYRAPNPPRGERSRDIEQMARLGFTVVKIQAHWNWINPRPGFFDLEEIREMMDSAAGHSLGVVLMASLENAPWWVAQRYPEARYVTVRGDNVDLQAVGGTPAGGWPGLCLDNEPVRRLAGRFVQRLVRTFKDHPALSHWHVWEEPHMEPTSNVGAEGHICNTLLCCCPASLEKFRRWLKLRHGGLAGVNRAWRARYSAWEQVRPPQRYGSYSPLMDWQRFQQENLAQTMAWRVATIRAIDPTHPIVSHLGANSVTSDDPFSPYMDDWLTARQVDAWGASAFPAWGSPPDGEAFMSVQLTAAASAAGSRPFWIGELQADGACTPDSIFIHDRPGVQRFAAWNWLAVGHGVKGIVLWQYRPELLGPESPGFGLCALDGSLTPRAEAAARVCKVVTATDALSNGRPPEPMVGILHSKDCNNLMRSATPSSEPLYSSMRGIHRMLSAANVPFRFVHIDLDGIEVMRRMSVLFFPFPLCIGPEQANALKEYVQQGGVLVCEAHVGHYDLNGYSSEQIPGMGLAELFGCTRMEENTARIGKEAIRSAQGDIEGRWIHEAYQLTTGSSIGFHRDGAPAVVCNAYGRGKAILFGSIVFASDANAQVLASYIPELCRGPVRTQPPVFARMLSTSSEAAVILVNPKAEGVSVEVSPQGVMVPDQVPDIWQERAWPAHDGRVSVALAGWETAVLSFKRAGA